MRKIIIAVAIFILVVSACVFLPSGKPVTVYIPEGSSGKEIGALLQGAGVIYSKQAFGIAVRLTGSTRRLKTGLYKFYKGRGVLAALWKITRGKSEQALITIPEGFTVADIAKRLAGMKVVKEQDFVSYAQKNALEGRLFPETYYFAINMKPKDVADKMIAEFNKHFTAEIADMARRSMLGEKGILTLASIVEKEAVRPEERALIAGVFINRLRKRWYLESCATVQYALGEHKARLTFKDIQVDSPYNTYRHLGLPPAPICNPGMASLQASLNPAKTDDMFFVAADSGTHVFSRYFSEHLKSKREIKRKNRSKR